METITAKPEEALFALLHPAFRDCCDPDNGRYDLSTPWVHGDFVYASNGVMIVRCPASPEIVAASTEVLLRGKRLKDPASVYGLSGFLPEPLTLPGPETLEECEDCVGTGRLPARRCYECLGVGVVECNLGHGHECPDCGGAGKIPACRCPSCGGFGRGEGRDASVKVGDHYLSHFFFLWLLHNGATVYGTDCVPDGKNPLRFTIGPDVEGRVMPMAPPTSG